ncbi:type II secretion system F family protein [Thalassomonas sp. M1454]|uniref:type II secretion system F family protein n=1 Tax=Thalassomonas sp. M1454 TaxID=2594477 RepID=UPI00117E15DC|nr:type II secretion system F family protein [Thalassomonas sp. M1454]TRX52807.1 type II secretion system F family protein [Thalassomonas sp. M1454]
MTIFHYIARNSEGKQVSGSIDASSSSAVAEQLSKNNIIPITIKPAKEEVGANKEINLQQYFVSKKVKAVDMIMFCRQMYALTRSGVPLLRAIKGLSESTRSEALKDALIDINEQLERGHTLSIAMSNHSNIFNKLITSIVHVGENTGQLDEAFAKLAQYLEREDETKKNIQQAIRYPFFVVIAIVIAMFVLNIFVIPVFANMFAQFQTELPLATQWLIASSNFFVDYWAFLLAAIFTGVFIFKRYLATEHGLYSWDKRKLKFPIVGPIIERSYLARFAHSFSIVLRTGVPITLGLSLTADAISNSYMADKVKHMRKKVETGETLLRTANNSGLFTPLVLQMIAVGEETGEIDKLLEEVAQYYEREVDYDLKTLTDKIEPILISIMAGLVLILALGIFLPMWDMYSAVQG